MTCLSIIAVHVVVVGVTIYFTTEPQGLGGLCQGEPPTRQLRKKAGYNNATGIRFANIADLSKTQETHIDYE
jgi:hypothetical protein